MTRRTWTWRATIWFVVIALVVGGMVGWALTRAGAAEPTDRAHTASSASDGSRVRDVVCGEGPGCTGHSVVRTAAQGRRKYRGERLGRAAADVRYPRKVRRVLVAEIRRAQRSGRLASSDAATGRAMSATAVFRQFRSMDYCVPRYRYETAKATCYREQGSYIDPTGLTKGKFTGRDVRTIICSGGAVGGLVGFAFRLGTVHPYGRALGVGAGWAVCMWQDVLEEKAG